MTTKTYDPHPIAELFPMLEPTSDAFKGFVEDIRERGQQEPIWLFEDKILEGRNRYRACQLLKLDARVQEYTGNDPIGFVLSANLHRRHLDASQRAMVGAKLANLGVGANQHTKAQGPSIEGAAKILNVGHASIERAKKVLASGDQELIGKVEKGEVPVSKAAEQVANEPDGTETKDKKTRKPRTETHCTREDHSPRFLYRGRDKRLVMVIEEDVSPACDLRS
jgi:ParB-like chromosome segregation protein Spo0J